MDKKEFWKAQRSRDEKREKYRQFIIDNTRDLTNLEYGLISINCDLQTTFMSEEEAIKFADYVINEYKKRKNRGG